MKKIMLFLSLCWITIDGFSQVGINTTSPDAQLQIKSSNQATPSNKDGLLIPKIDAFPVTNPTAAQQGMMVYLTTISAGKAPGFYYWDNTGVPQWKGIGGNAGWEILGNAGTDSSVNFIGTTDATDVVFRRDNVISGKIGMANTSFGRSAMNPLNSGIYNSAFGLSSMLSNTTGSSNAAFGNYTLFSNTTGSSNTGVGSNTLYTNTIGQHNTALGSNSLEYNTQGNDNAAIGYYSLYKNTLGNNNTANGNEALYENLTGNNNTAIGHQSGNTITSGSNNLTLGANSNVPLPTGSNQLSIGNVIYGAAMNASSFAKIGINEPSPNAKLQINASSQLNPTSTDGIIIPKIDAFPFLNPGSLQNGMLVFLTTPANKSGFYYWDNPSTSWKGIGANSGWGLTGNAGTTAATNFMGTTDDIDVVFKRNNVKSGLISSSNTAFGLNALSSNTFGNDNFASGVGALQGNTASGKNIAIGNNALFTQNFPNTGVAYDTNNVAIGVEALYSNNPTASNNGSENVALGNYALRTNNRGLGNTAIGYQSLYANTTGNQNVAIGRDALLSNTTGNSNMANGNGSLYSNTTGNYNIAFGTQSLLNNLTGNSNIACGFMSLNVNTVGDENISIGRDALSLNVAGSNAVAVGTRALQYTNPTATAFDNKNIAIGYEALRGSTIVANNTGFANTAVGYQALLLNSSGSWNAAIGGDSLASNTTGSGNQAFGRLSLNANTTGSFNIATGYNALLRNTNGSNNVAIGNAAVLSNTAGNDNTAIGSGVLSANSSGNGNIAFGTSALNTNSSGNNNIALGFQSGNSNTTGSNNIIIGANANALSPTLSNQMSIANVLYGDAIDNIATARFSIGDIPSVSNKFYTYSQQLTANGDGQSSIYGYRTRDSQNDGTGYGRATTNRAVGGYNLWGDVYTFGITGHCDNDFTRTGGVLGSITGGTYWSSLGYKNSGGIAYGVYATAALSTGTGRFSQPQKNFSIGGGFYGGMIGSWSRGNIIGQVSSGTMFASYNSGDEYTSGKQIELVATGNQKTAAYTVTSTESIVYKKGKITLTNGTARVDFDENYVALLGEIPVVTITPMGQCNGLFIESIDQKGFTIKELNNGTSNVAVSWIAVGDRIDAQQNNSSKVVLEKDFDNQINEIMFNENNKTQNAKAMWFDGTNIQFGQLPSEFIEKTTTKKNNNVF